MFLCPFFVQDLLLWNIFFFSSTSHWSIAVLKGYCVTVDGECNFELLKNNDAKLLFENKREEMAQMLEESWGLWQEKHLQYDFRVIGETLNALIILV